MCDLLLLVLLFLVAALFASYFCVLLLFLVVSVRFFGVVVVVIARAFVVRCLAFSLECCLLVGSVCTSHCTQMPLSLSARAVYAHRRRRRTFGGGGVWWWFTRVIHQLLSAVCALSK